MRNLLNISQDVLVWGLFFATSVYGHVALKMATGHGSSYNLKKAGLAMTSVWGWTAILSWMFSCVLWALVLTKNTAIAANTISALRYVFICVAAAVALKETLQWRDVLGIAFVTVGILLLIHKSYET